MSTFTLDDLAATIAARAREGDASASYTARLLTGGVAKCAKKFGEEAVEAALAAVAEDDAALIGEAGDVLYHLLVMLQARGVALEAVMDGFRVMPIVEAAAEGDIFITVTGDVNVIDEPSFARMKSGAILANSGHFDSEINLPALDALTEAKRELRDNVEEYALGDGRRLVVLAGGRLVNLGAAEGHPASVMDMSFANQALSAEYIAREHAGMEPNVYDVPLDIDREVARLKLAAMGVTIDTLTDEQRRYLSSWDLEGAESDGGA